MNKTEFRHTIFSLSEYLFPMVSRMLGQHANAEDAIQEIMLKLWMKRKQLKNHPNIKGFVILTARNHCIDLLRKQKIRIQDLSYPLEQLHTKNRHNQLEWEELHSIIKDILKSLPENQRTVLLMRDLDGYEIAEIAAATELKAEHVRVLLSRARKQVGIKLEKTYRYERG